MMAVTLGEVVESRDPSIPVGCHVTTLLARIMGLRAVGIAGSKAKCDWAVDKAGFDACVRYKSPDFASKLAAACPRGIDIDFEHIGGAVLAAILPLMVYGGRLVMSGLIGQYNDAVAPPGPNWGVIIAKALTVCGLRVFDHFALMPEWERLVSSRTLDGGFAYAEDISIGLGQAPGALARVLTGGNFGKTLVQVV